MKKLPFSLINFQFASFEEHFSAFSCAGSIFDLIFKLFFVELTIHVEVFLHKRSLIVLFIDFFLPKTLLRTVKTK